MKTLSIQQPWAWAILHAGKDIENRTWKTNFRGRILIQASKRIDYDAINYLKSINYNPPIFSLLNTMGIVGSVEIIDCVKSHESKWFSGPFGYVLKNPITIPFKKCKGQLSFFEIDYFNL